MLSLINLRLIKGNAKLLDHCCMCVCLFVISSSSNPEQQTPFRPPYSETRGHDEDEAEYRRQLAEQTKRGYYNPQKYKDTEL